MSTKILVCMLFQNLQNKVPSEMSFFPFKKERRKSRNFKPTKIHNFTAFRNKGDNKKMLTQSPKEFLISFFNTASANNIHLTRVPSRKKIIKKSMPQKTGYK